MTKTFNIGDYVINFDYFAVVIGILEDGSILLENGRIGKWVAAPNLCTTYIPPKEVW